MNVLFVPFRIRFVLCVCNSACSGTWTLISTVDDVEIDRRQIVVAADADRAVLHVGGLLGGAVKLVKSGAQPATFGQSVVIRIAQTVGS